ncbi:MAG TPA: hypothetical protein VKY73_01880 [Polyangiaceae bacterium]|nr:hypothetical protein [Polyangiaceae bacterium]
MRRGAWFYRLRVTLLGSLLAAVCLWACYDVMDRRARNEWSEPVTVGVVLLRFGDVSPEALTLLTERVRVLERRLSMELRRHRPEAEQPMIRLVPYGPVEVTELPPSDPGSTLWERLVHTVALFRYTRAVDAAASVPTLRLDSRIYLVAEPPGAGVDYSVEGYSEAGGRVGVTRVSLDVSTVDLGLFVVAHELFHTLGASDKYDEHGRTRIPEGLAEPERVPLFPQPGAEIMARNRVIGAAREMVPESLDELFVGRWTAREIGWLTAPLRERASATPIADASRY